MLPSGLPEAVADDERLARFLTSSSQYNSLGVKQSAFLPERVAVETSVFRHDSEPRNDLWRIAADNVHSRTVYGAAIVTARNVRDIRLDVVSDEPPPRHAAIRQWPVDANDPELTKAKQKEIAIQLASVAQFVAR